MSDIGKVLIVVGLGIAVLGLMLWTGFGRSWLGKLPGDIHIARGNFSFYFPLMTCVVISVLLTLAAWLFRLFR